MRRLRLRLLTAVGVGKFQDLAVDTGVGDSSIGVGEMVDEGDRSNLEHDGEIR